MNWNRLTVPITRDEIAKYVKDATWQSFRESLKGKSLPVKYRLLSEWLEVNEYDRASLVQVSNYCNALKRGGLI